MRLQARFGAVAALLILMAVSAAPASAGVFTNVCRLTAQNSPTTVGQQARFRFFAAAQTPEDTPPAPGGVVTLFDEDGNLLDTQPLITNGPTLDNASVVLSTSSLSVGDHQVRAVLFPAITPPGPCPVTEIATASHHVNPPPASPSSTVVTSSANPSRFQQNVTFSASVTRTGGGAVAGTVQFRDNGTDLGGPQAVDGSGNASVSSANLGVGNHAITADFTSTNANTLNSASAPLGQTVLAADTSTAVTSSVNPSEFGQSVTFTAKVTAVAPGGGTPNGTVQFTDGATNVGGPQTLDGSGSAAVSTAALSPGNHTIQATYTPANGTYNGSSGSVAQTVDKATTVTTYTGPTTGDFHDPVTLTAALTLRTAGSALPGRTITFTLGSVGCSGQTNTSGVASCTVTPQDPAGPTTVKASFSGDAENKPSEDSRAFVITREQTTLTYTGTTVIQNGGTARASALLTEDNGAPPLAGRSVTFTLGNQSCTALTDAAGRAACDIAPVNQPLGPATIMSKFAQDAYYLASSDSDAVILFAFPSKGAFAIGDKAGPKVTFFGSQWDKDNALTGGAAPSAFKGFVSDPPVPPRCGGTWTAGTGNSDKGPDTVPKYMGTLVASKVTKSGSTISGDIVRIVVVNTSTYGSSPGQGGTGTVVATVC